MRIYFDCCALGRLTDAISQPRLRAELDAVNAALESVLSNENEWLSSFALERELRRNPDTRKRSALLNLLTYAEQVSLPEAQIQTRAAQLIALGYGAGDAAHLAAAEEIAADVLLTTDDRFLGRARNGIGQPRTKVMNPVEWQREVRHGYAGD